MPTQPEYKSAAELKALSNSELADHIEASTWEWDWTTPSAREAIVRLLRREQEGRLR